MSREEGAGKSNAQYTVFVVNNGIHTGIIIPVDSTTMGAVRALKYFKDFKFADIGWGEEAAYQDLTENYFHDARAILIRNPSVNRIEGYNIISDYFTGMSDFTIRLTLSGEQFTRLIYFIDKSFKNDAGNELIITSKRHSGDIIFFKSVYKYHLFHTCNTWIAEALQSAGLDISPFFVITRKQLYNEIRDHGTVLKSLK